MSRHSTARHLSGFLLAAWGLSVSAQPSSAQAAQCNEISPKLIERKAIVEKLQVQGKQKLDPKFACSMFGQLVSNGATLIKWVDANKDWCQVPPSFVDGIKADHGRATTMRTKACAIAAQQVQMQKKAKEQAAQGGGLLGGNSLQGEFHLPQGAL